VHERRVLEIETADDLRLGLERLRRQRFEIAIEIEGTFRVLWQRGYLVTLPETRELELWRLAPCEDGGLVLDAESLLGDVHVHCISARRWLHRYIVHARCEPYVTVRYLSRNGCTSRVVRHGHVRLIGTRAVP
jgi:hypothetical protein